MQKLDTKFVQPFIEATTATLKVQCKIDAKLGKPYLKDKTNNASIIDIAGVLGITSETFNGSIALCFPEKTFLAVMGGMLGETYTTINAELEDGASELTNIIFGYAKRILNQNGCTLQKALPSIVKGKGIQLSSAVNTPVIVLPFETDQGTFHIEIGMLPLEKAA